MKIKTAPINPFDFSKFKNVIISLCLVSISPSFYPLNKFVLDDHRIQEVTIYWTHKQLNGDEYDKSVCPKHMPRGGANAL